ncbi:MAG: FAD binding domain-containing protein [Acetobacteraceae bacterium]|jgi:xanthine dehydrogenase YagS FAD-binding subunit
MERFAWQSARSVAEAATLAGRTVAAAMLTDPTQPAAPDCVVMKAGGIDLLDLMKEGVLRPARLVNLREIPGLDSISEDGDGMRIGALATLEQIATHPMLRQRYTALADAAASSASPQIRHVATLGGNLLQRPRCWYFRSAAHRCARKGGNHCFAFTGENQYHAVFGQAGCAIVHPSTAATALAAFDARVELVNAQGAARSMPFDKFVVGPDTDITRETDLRGGEVLTAVLLPPVPASARSVFFKQGEKSFDWSIADVAIVLDRAPDGRCRHASIVLGAAAPVPWRAAQAEAALAGQMIDATVARAAGQAAIAGAVPLRHNAYKLPILATLVRRAVLQAAAATNQETVR